MHIILIVPFGFIKDGFGKNLFESTAFGIVKHI
jgi:hypothetical protein